MFTLSMHCEDNFPFKKEKSDLDIGLKAGTTDSEYLTVLSNTFIHAMDFCKPDFVIYDAGVDVAEEDILGKLCLSNDGIYKRDYFVLHECRKRCIPVAGLIGGGYDMDPLKLSQRHAMLFKAAIASYL